MSTYEFRKFGKCRLEPTQTATTSQILCRRHGPIWPKLERHVVSSPTCRDMSATFPAKRVTHISYVGRYIGLVQSRINNMSWRTNGVNLVPRKHTNCQAFLTSIIKHNIRQITQWSLLPLLPLQPTICLRQLRSASMDLRVCQKNKIKLTYQSNSRACAIVGV